MNQSKSVTAGLVSTELKVCKSSYSTAQVCVCVCVLRCMCAGGPPGAVSGPPGVALTSASWITAPVLQLEK